MKKYNVAIVGMGFIGKLHYDALRRLPNVHIRTIVVHRESEIPLVKQAYDVDIVTTDWREAVADPQIQVIHNCTPNALHDEVNLAAIAAGKHIYAEKPMSLTTQRAEAAYDAANAAGDTPGINYQYRMHAADQEMRGQLPGGTQRARRYVRGLIQPNTSARL